MAYDLKLAERIHAQLKGKRYVEKKMFGGVGFLLKGNTLAPHCVRCSAGVACGVHKNDLIVRVAPEKHAELLKRAHVRSFDLTGKPMKGWLIVKAEGCKTDKQLGTWVEEGVQFALTLPPK